MRCRRLPAGTTLVLQDCRLPCKIKCRTSETAAFKYRVCSGVLEFAASLGGPVPPGATQGLHFHALAPRTSRTVAAHLLLAAKVDVQPHSLRALLVRTWEVLVRSIDNEPPTCDDVRAPASDTKPRNRNPRTHNAWSSDAGGLHCCAPFSSAAACGPTYKLSWTRVATVGLDIAKRQNTPGLHPEHSRTPPRRLVHGHRVAHGYDKHQ